MSEMKETLKPIIKQIIRETLHRGYGNTIPNPQVFDYSEDPALLQVHESIVNYLMTRYAYQYNDASQDVGIVLAFERDADFFDEEEFDDYVVEYGVWNGKEIARLTNPDTAEHSYFVGTIF